MAEVWAVIKLIPQIFSVLKELMSFIQKTFGDTPEKFLKDAGEAFSKYNNAKTDEEKVDAIKSLQSLIRRT